jgi:arylsulfatase A-like enzyme
MALASCARESQDVNVLVVVWDTTRADHLSPYGANLDLPHLEALAARGVRFDQARSVSSLTPVSAASFLSGQLPPRTGVRSLLVNEGSAMAGDVTTLAQWMQAAGRATAAFVSAPPMGHRYGFERGFDVFDDDVNAHADTLRAAKVGNAYQRRAEATTDAALAWLQATDEPFGLLVHCFDAHDPSLVPPRAFLESRVAFDLPADLDSRMHLGELFDGAEPGQGGPRADDLIALYNAEIEYMDAQLGRLLDALETTGRLDNTLIVLLADHGESLGQHDFWTHGLMWDEQLRVPLIMAGPGVVARGGQALPVSLLGLAPTVAELAGVAAPAGLMGESFAALLADATSDVAPQPAFSEAHHALGDRTGRPPAVFAVTIHPWKLIVQPGAPERLFRLDSDPGELDDLASSKPQLVANLRALLEQALMDQGASPLHADALDAETRAMLIELGYL